MKKVGILRTSMLECSVDFPIHGKEQELSSVLSPQIISGVNKGMLVLTGLNCEVLTLSHRVKSNDFIFIDIA